MTARLASLPKAAQVALVASVLLLVLLVGYFALIAPKRSTAADLKKQTAAVQAEINSNRSTAFTQALPAVRSASVFRETQAMPNKLDTPDVIITLSELARNSGISFDSITPQGSSTTSSTTSASTAPGVPTTTTGDPFASEAIQVKFTGSFYNLLTFLQRVRNLVRVENGRLFTAGRLFDVSGVSLAQGPKGWPQVTATLVINEFVPLPAASTTAPSSTGTTSTTTTPTTTTSGTSAAPSTSGGTS